MSGKPELDPENVRVGATIRVIRQSFRMSAAELADAVGKSEPLILAIERGTRRPSPELCAAIAEAVRVPLEAIIAPVKTETAA